MSPSTKRRRQNVAQDEASRTKRRKTKREGREVVTPSRPGKNSKPTHAVQVGTSICWWKSSGLKAGDQVPVSRNPTDFWLQRRAEDKLWSFQTKRKNLHVTYNGDDQNVTLESDSSTGKKKFFAMLLQPENKYMLADPCSLNRFLGAKDGNLAMVESADAMEWKIKDSQIQITDSSAPESKRIEVLDSESLGQKWISNKVHVQDRVRVNQSHREEWIISGSAAEPTFQVPNRHYYASRNGESKYDVVFESDKSNVNLRQFMLKRNPRIRRGAVVIQTTGPHKMYVGKQGRDRKFLQLKQDELDATGWILKVTDKDC